MARKPNDRSTEFGARLAQVLDRAGVPRQRVARSLSKVYPEGGDFRAWEAKLLRYVGGLVPKPHELDAIMRAIVWPRELASDVARWCVEGVT